MTLNGYFYGGIGTIGNGQSSFGSLHYTDTYIEIPDSVTNLTLVSIHMDNINLPSGLATLSLRFSSVKNLVIPNSVSTLTLDGIFNVESLTLPEA
jgi:hypothetical protein